jgi:histidinol-phosphate aminotransferase
MIYPSCAALMTGEVYVPGLSAEHVAETYGIAPHAISKLGSAENPHGPSPKALLAVREAAERISLYPDWTAAKLRLAIGTKFGIDPDNVVCGSGETEVISMLIRAFARPDDAVLMHSPCFPLYRIYANCEGRKPIFVNMGADFDPVMDQYIDALQTHRPKIAFLTNPHNPSGRMVSEADVVRVCEAAPPETLVALDEAYVHYTENPYGIGLLHRFPNLLVLRTLSKAYGLAGLRVGFGISANRNLILPMRHIKPTWNMGQMQIAGGIAGINDDEHVARTVKTVVEMRAYVAQRMQGLSAFRMVPGSGANFFLTEISKPDLDSTLVFNELLKRGVIVKDGSDIIGLGSRYLRVDVNLQVHMDRFVNALEDIQSL